MCLIVHSTYMYVYYTHAISHTLIKLGYILNSKFTELH